MLKNQIFAGISAALAIAALAYIEAYFEGVILLMAPFGATAVLVFGLPDSPLAKPKNVIFGHLITTFIGLVFIQYFEVTPLMLGLATGLGVSAMLMLKSTHPPAGANPLLIMLSGIQLGWSFLITPVLIGAILIVLIGQLMQSVSKRYVK